MLWRRKECATKVVYMSGAFLKRRGRYILSHNFAAAAFMNFPFASDRKKVS